MSLTETECLALELGPTPWHRGLIPNCPVPRLTLRWEQAGVEGSSKWLWEDLPLKVVLGVGFYLFLNY